MPLPLVNNECRGNRHWDLGHSSFRSQAANRWGSRFSGNNTICMSCMRSSAIGVDDNVRTVITLVDTSDMKSFRKGDSLGQLDQWALNLALCFHHKGRTSEHTYASCKPPFAESGRERHEACQGQPLISSASVPDDLLIVERSSCRENSSHFN
jgi:hypothetical protein